MISTAADFHLFEGGEVGPHLLLADGSQVFGVDAAFAEALRVAEPDVARAMLGEVGLGGRNFIDAAPLEDPPMRALSLSVAQRCNLGCTYCYAGGGDFGAPPRDMEWAIADAAIRRLIGGVDSGERVNLAFLGGEPLSNSPLIRRATELAAELAAAKRVRIGFAITTNGTLLGDAEGDFLARFGFSVTISLDGVGPVHDQLRPTKGGRGSFDRIRTRVIALRRRHPRLPIAARVTVTPRNLDLRETLDCLLELGFELRRFLSHVACPKRARRDAGDRPQLLVAGDDQMRRGI